MKSFVLVVLCTLCIAIQSEAQSSGAFGFNKYSQNPYVSIVLNDQIDNVWAKMGPFDTSVAIMTAGACYEDFKVDIFEGCSPKQVGAVFNFTSGGYPVRLRLLEISDHEYRRKFEIYQASYP